ncbi:NifU family protein [Salarchaeum sp. III]|uniref:NifU family protein n=1 Tax=Salarchaeum sp. III TaxID=3107927 RepID=UPI002EDA85A2
MSDAATDASLHDEVETWLTAQMPIIKMHGGTSAVREADPETGEVVIELGGTCSGCGISPRTAQRIKTELAKEFPRVTDVTVRFASDGSDNWGTEQAESVMGIDRNEGGRGGRGESGPGETDHQSHF